MRTEKIPIKTAAKILGVSVLCVQERMRRGIYPIGLYIPKEKSGKKCDRFEVYRTKLEAFIGKEIELEEEGEK